MATETRISRAIRTLCASGMVMSSGLLGAQELQKVEITGSRIPTANLEGTSPITVMRAKDIKLDGVLSVEAILNNLPQVFAGQGANIANGATGTATVNLRNFGADRTLVLVNGRRLPAGSPLSTAADLNQIPAPLIKRVEVLTGGASAVYGSDAVAGVVNFIMIDNFQGIQLDLNKSFYNHNQNGGAPANAVKSRDYPLPGNIGADGSIKDMSLLLGGNFEGGKGNATVFFTYKKEDAILQASRDFSACSLGGFSSASGLNCGGSGTSYPGRFIIGSNSKTVADANGGVRPYLTSDQYNFGPLNYFQRPSEAYGFNASAHFKFNETSRVYTEASFNDYRTVAQIAPSGLFGFDASGGNALRFENPLLSDAWKAALGMTGPGSTGSALIFRRNVEGGGRQNNLQHSAYRGVVGVKGDVGKWNYDIFAQYGRVNLTESYRNDFSLSRAAKALDVVADANGNPVCRSKLNGTDTACVPYNIWSLDKVSPEALAYLQTPGFENGYTSQSVQSINLSSDLGDYGIKLPWASSGVGVSFGFEHRTEKLELNVDNEFDSGDLAGQGGPTHGVAGSISVRDYFMEARIPIVEKMPWAEQLSANLSYRRSEYSNNNQTNSWGFGGEWAPVKSTRLRTSYQRAVRSPNVVELFTPQGLSLYTNTSDPCSGATPKATLAQCANTGVTAAQYGHIDASPAQQYNQITGGNTNLKPETSDSYTLGLVLTPAKNLSFTVDYFNMKVKDVILGLPPTTSLNQCLAKGDPRFCSLITRDRLGSLWALPSARIVAVRQNLGLRKTTGFDLSGNYSHKLAQLGNLDFSLIGTYLKEFKQEDVPGTGVYDCATLYGPGCTIPLPKWRHKLRGGWNTPWQVDMALTWRHINSVKATATSSNPVLAGTSQPIDRELGARDYIDLVGVWNFRKGMSFQLGINNLFDRDPPVSGITVSTFGSGNTFPEVYDTLGRKVFLNFSAKF